MKKVTAVVVGMLALSAVISVNTEDNTAEAVIATGGGDRDCYQDSNKWFLGMKDDQPLNFRYAELDIHLTGCDSNDGNKEALVNPSSITADIDANSTSIAAGVEWHVKTPTITKQNNWQLGMYVEGSFRKCVAYHVPICSPTGTFKAGALYTADYLLHRSNEPRYYWHIWPTNSWANEHLAIYNTP